MRHVVTATEIRQYVTCPCGLFLDHHGPQDAMAQAHAFVEHLQQLGFQHEQRIAAELPHISVPVGPLERRVAWTMSLMRRGVERIRHAALIAGDLAGVPEFLEKTDTPSDLGGHSYRPVDVKISASPKPEDTAQLAVYGILLGHLQGLVPDSADLILFDGSRVTIDLHDHIAQTREVLPLVQAVIEGRPVSPTLSVECGMCPWSEYCLRTLYDRRDISLIDGVGPAKKLNLVECGYRDLSAVAAAEIEDLRQCKGIGAKTASQMILQAATLLAGHHRIIARPRLPDAEIGLYLDLECQQGSQVIYLIGVLECRAGGGAQFIPFVADAPEDEGDMWAGFLDYLRRLPGIPVIYHYHCFESTHMRKLAERHGIDADCEERLFGGLLDLHKVLKTSVMLPLHSYGLKPVAKWLGFRWRETAADAAMSMPWFDLWLSSADRSYLEASIRYNEDDCRATRVVKEWLASVGRDRRRSATPSGVRVFGSDPGDDQAPPV